MDDELRERLIETAQAVAESPPSSEEVLVAGRRRRWRMRGVVAVLVFIAGLLFVAVSFAGFYGRAAVRPFDVPLVAQPTQVPDVVDASLSAARNRLDAGLKADPATPCEQQEACRVEKQSPLPGARVEKGAAVELRLSPPRPRLVAVPAVVGLDRDAATKAVTDAGLQVESDEQCPEATLPCRVADQSPAGTREVQHGTTIRLVLRDGPLVTVPDVVGQPEMEARNTLDALGLVADVAPCAAPTGCAVASQNPQGGQEVVRGTHVALELKEITGARVPTVVGLPAGDAVAAIERAQLEAVLQPACPQEAVCKVSGQSIAPGVTVEVHTTVVLSLRVIQQGPDEH